MEHKGVRFTLIVLEAFVALTSTACGVGMAAGAVQFPVAWLVGTPFSDYIMPGLVMAAVVGGSSFLAAEMTRAGRGGGVVASALAGLLLMGFEVAEVTMIDRNLGNWLPFAVGFQAIYSTLSLTIFGLAAFLWRTRHHRRHFQTRHVSQA